MPPVLSISKYDEISKKLKAIQDVGRISEEYGLDVETMSIIFYQKEVRRMIRIHGKIMSKRADLLDEWNKGVSIVKLAEKERFSPMLMAHILLAAMNVSKKRTKKILKNPEIVDDERLEREIREAMEADYLYSPRAHEEQMKRGLEGEERLFAWLDSMGVEYTKESEMPNTEGRKTPDALLKNPIEIGGKEVRWLDSKASFGDPEEIKRSYKRQFKSYIELFGPGAVIYWYGYVKMDLPDGLIVLDSLEKS